MKKFISQYVLDRKWICRYLAVLLLLALLPMLVIARCDHPCADDFTYGNYVVSTWRDTGSLPATLSAAAAGTKAVYQTWQGSFAAVFLMMLQPAIFSEGLYALVPFVLLLGFVAACFLLLKVVLMDYCGADRYSCGIVSIFVTFLSVQFVYSPVEAFYWYNGAMYYTGFHTLSLVLSSLVLLSAKTSGRAAAATYAVLVPILGFLVGGSNFITALSSAVIMALFFAYRLFVARRKWLVPLLGLAAVCAALLISALAPGNALRQENFQSMHPGLAVASSFWYGLRFVYYFVRVPVYFAFASLVPLLYAAMGCSPFSFRLPGLATALFYCVYASTFTPNLYAMSSFGMERVINVNYYAFLLFFLITLCYWCGWIARKVSPAPAHNTAGKDKKAGKQDPSVARGMTGILFACFVIGCLLVADTGGAGMSSVSAVSSLLSGEAEAYHREYLERLSVFEDPAVSRAEVAEFSVKPRVLFFDDITADPGDWRNQAVAAFYSKESVAIQ